ncbi:hypothetical protein [Arenibacter certesii]|uniref:Beta-lactamase-inhibitor-like PepSY-like domain-containing protein n=2 Tax=Arenibacter certesii TaxID=228955 RepID=A0A918J4K2_9FLAO|nr:hypothetical protein [Arenibacter certesii]GGW46604.1 hypothetical protein GCM10007383_33560 [Arenibacter certesii]GGW46627.1 hypothetical protein GCM10007383_33590 [Arenibacter certesii]
MKKILFVAALSLGSLTAFAQEGEEVTQEVATEVAVAQDDFTAIEINDLPEAVSTAVATDHASASIKTASVNKEEQYKLEVTLEDGTEATLYADKEGNWIELE